MASNDMPSFSFDISGLDGLQAALAAMPDKVKQGASVGLYQHAEIVMTASKQVCPVDTGTLLASIKKNVQRVGFKVIGTIWTDNTAPYAGMVEYGTSKMKARPFFRPAIELTKSAINQMFKK